jgi:hypothetical protein
VWQSEALDEARKKFEAEKKALHEEIALLQSKCRSALAGAVLSALPEADEREKLLLERDQAASELQRCRAELEGFRSTALWNEERLRRKEADLARSLEREEETNAERDELKRSCESLETRVMVLEMEKKNIQQIEESKYKVLLQHNNECCRQLSNDTAKHIEHHCGFFRGRERTGGFVGYNWVKSTSVMGKVAIHLQMPSKHFLSPKLNFIF